ncbi:mitochondrial ribosome-associated GTPase 2 isoform X3 [Rhinatrema bivittatum]|uniref:mitochondrial ribosome-associated GTPase 2 isoform X3 n=1 Tax=Rhinatrema bivittatum TaxID=194408 RepID=UPI001129140F|nr:mitochondrial ribosome-associated GTPase 2 isoform X3 [Rhinatrema bivittatum]
MWLCRQPVYASLVLTCALQQQVPHCRMFSTSCATWASQRRPGKKRNLSEKKLTRYFVDQRRVSVFGGKGGRGASCFHSEPRKEFGGPDGGDGGNGGHVILKVDGQVKSLSLVQPVYRGIDGVPGSSKNCFGCNGENLYIKVPLGTLVKENGNVVADLSQPGDEYVAALGGDGGKGNRFFLTNENRAPVTATMGQEGQERTLQLELKTMAHAGMVGFPNAGKSSLLRTISNARPAVASYPFTTLNPHVGIIQYQDYEQLAVADIPGIIQGAHQNRGLGFAFLRHIERCRFLLYVLDLSAAEPWTQFQDLKYELEAYEEGLSRRPCLIVGNKIDLLQSRVNLPLLRERVGEKVIAVSALTGHNVEELILYLRELYDSCIDTDLSKLQKPLRW